MATFRGWPDSRRDPGPMQGMAGWPEAGNQAGWANIARRLNRRHPINSGLVGWWPMDDGRGTRVRDLSTYANHGTITNAADPATATSGWGAGASQRDLVLDGSNDYVIVPDSDSLSITGDLTLSYWFGSSFPNYSFPISKGSSGIAAPYFAFWYPGGQTRLLGRGNGTTEGSDAGITITLPLNVLTHHAVTMRGTATAHYMNGALIFSGTLSTTIGDAGGPLYFGRRGDGYYTPMTMRHFRIYNRALSAAEVKQIYADPWIGAY